MIKKILPGLILCGIIAFIGKSIGILLPSLGGATFAILLGLIVSNTILKSDKFKKGIEFSEKNLLSFSIVLLGGTVSIESIKSLGIKGVLYIFLQMIFTIIFVIGIGKKLGFSKKFQSLMASGNAVCGSSAIGAVSPVIIANESEKGIVITIVNLTGTILMFLLIPLSKAFFSFNTLQTSAFLGGILQSMGQVVAAGSLINSEIQEMSVIFKIIRILFLVIVVMVFSKRHKDKESSEKVKMINIPWYIMGFLILCILYSIGFIPSQISKILKTISGQFELIALAGIGMSVKIDTLISQGIKASLYGIIVGLFQIIVSFTLINILF